MKSKQDRAVVLGASVAGLFAARVLADFFDEVLLLDKESLDEANSEKGRAAGQSHPWHSYSDFSHPETISTGTNR